MGKEIERKFLVKNNDFKALAKPVLLYQGFLNTEKERVVRVRIAGSKGFLTIKGVTRNACRTEYEYEIPKQEALEMLQELCIQPTIIKERYTIAFHNCIWEVDVFKNENEGLVIAEIELKSEDQQFEKPKWVGKEVTHLSEYYNSNLISFPFNKW
jgi:adenylate cyclase